MLSLLSCKKHTAQRSSLPCAQLSNPTLAPHSAQQHHSVSTSYRVGTALSPTRSLAKTLSPKMRPSNGIDQTNGCSTCGTQSRPPQLCIAFSPSAFGAPFGTTPSLPEHHALCHCHSHVTTLTAARLRATLPAAWGPASPAQGSEHDTTRSKLGPWLATPKHSRLSPSPFQVQATIASTTKMICFLKERRAAPTAEHLPAWGSKHGWPPVSQSRSLVHIRFFPAGGAK